MPQAVNVATVVTTPAADVAPAQIYLVADIDFVIPLVFPDYEIHIDGINTTWFGKKIELIAERSQPYLGHAGVLIIDGKKGVSKYYEYGRYKEVGGVGPAGRVRRGNISNVSIVGGQITESSLKKTLREISEEHGQSGRIEGVVLRGAVFGKASQWLEEKWAENKKKDREEYDLGNHNCITFAADLAKNVGFSIPLKSRTVVPTLYMYQFQLSEIDIEYSYSTDVMVISE